MKQKKKIIGVLALCFSSIALGAAANNIIGEIKAQLRPDFTIVIDGQVRNFKNAQGEKVEPILYDGTTYLPIRAIGEIMGKTVYWYEEDKKIELKDSSEVTVTDADVIINDTNDDKSAQNSEKNKVKEEKPQKEKPEKDKTNYPDKEIDTSLFIGEDKAKEVALEKAGISSEAVLFEKVKLDKDDGVWIYEVEFRHERTEYEAEIKAEDGTVLSWDTDIYD